MKTPTTTTAYALVYTGKYGRGVCITRDNALAIFLHKWEAEEEQKKWGRPKPKVVKVTITI